ncbi:MAG: cytochrome c, partial [Candidatus Tectomicrobia bacterium]
RRLVAFVLDGDTPLPAQPPPYVPEPLVYPDFPVDEALAMRGARLYGAYCGICHGGGVVANAMAPDLRASGVSLDFTAFAEVVREGTRVDRSMPAFAALDDEELEAIRHYIRAVAHRDAGGAEE